MENLQDVRKIRRIAIILGLLVLSLVVILVSLSTGYANVTIHDVLRIFMGNGTVNENLVVFQFRLPRLILACLVGMGLALSGALLQSLSRNDLADPGILGINVGAGIMVVIIYRYFPKILISQPFFLPIAAFIGALGVALLICWLSINKDKGFSPMKMILMGIAIAAAGNAFILVTSLRLDRATYVAFSTWNIGNISGATWSQILVLLPWIVILIPIVLTKAKTLDALTLGEQSATSLGVNLFKEQMLLLMLAVALAAASVSIAGGIGFVGLIAPHISRRLVGSIHQYSLITAALMGALLLMISDTVARVVFNPSEIPVGIVITVIGAPYFLYLLRKANKN